MWILNFHNTFKNILSCSGIQRTLRGMSPAQSRTSLRTLQASVSYYLRETLPLHATDRHTSTSASKIGFWGLDPRCVQSPNFTVSLLHAQGQGGSLPRDYLSFNLFRSNLVSQERLTTRIRPYKKPKVVAASGPARALRSAMANWAERRQVAPALQKTPSLPLLPTITAATSTAH